MASSSRSIGRRVAGGLAAYLAELELASWDAFGEGTPYSSSTPWPVYLGPDMPISPDRVIVITPGPSTNVRANVEMTAQIRLRGGRPEDGVDVAAEVADHAQAIEDAFLPNGRPLIHTMLGDIPAGLVEPINGLDVSADGNRRAGHILNVRIRVRPTRNRVIYPGVFGAGIYGEGIYG